MGYVSHLCCSGGQQISKLLVVVFDFVTSKCHRLKAQSKNKGDKLFIMLHYFDA